MGDSEAKYLAPDLSTDDQYYASYSNVIKPAFTECLNSWLHYLQMLNGLCAAGARVSASIRSLSPHAAADHLYERTAGPTDWEEPARTMLAVTSMSRTRVMLLFQHLEACRRDPHAMDDINQQLIYDNIMSVVNLHYGFVMTSTDRLHNVNLSTCWKLAPTDYQERDCGVTLPRLSCFSPSFPPRIEEIVTESEPHMSNEMNRGILDSPMHKCEHGKCANFECYNCRKCNGQVDRNESSRLGRKEYRNIGYADKSQISQGSSSSSDGLQSYYGHPRNIYNYGNVSGGPVCAPTASDFIRSPLNPFVDISRGPNHPENLRGPFPAPGTLASAKTPFQKPSRGGNHRSALSKLQPSQPRRWSEAAAHEMCEREDDAANARRWSVPWDGGPPPPPPQIHTEASDYWRDKCCSNGSALDGILMGDQDPLAAAILLLSCRPPASTAEPRGIPVERSAPRPRTNPANPINPATLMNQAENPKGYSMWSGSDALPFLRLPESLEHTDENIQSPGE